MSMVVSYKKQVVLGILLLAIFLGAIEVIVNIWLYNFYTCAFETNEMFKNADPEFSRKLCIESVGYDFTKENITSENGTRPGRGLDESVVFLNSDGFRSPEFSKEKPSNTYRIFVMGGSSTFGVGVLDNQTYSHYLQKLYDKNELNYDVEIINSGISGYFSLQETKLIKNQLLFYEPDLFIVYDGWNDLIQEQNHPNENSALIWKERWLEICELGKQNGYDTIITLQPLVNTGKNILTEQEYRYFLKIEEEKLTKPYPQYLEQLKVLKNHCTITADLRDLFDNVQEPIFFDRGHTGPKGNQIIAEKFFEISLPVILEGKKNIENQENLPKSIVVNLDEKSFVMKVSDIIKEIISPYKTPRVIPLIF